MTPYLTLAALLFVYMTGWFIASIIKKRNDVADVAWGLGFILLSWSALLLSGTVTTPSLLTNTLVTIWGLRLAWHIHGRNRNRSEDYRYEEWRKQWGSLFYLRSFFQIYILQGLFLFLIVTPVIFINLAKSPTLPLIGFTGVLFWIAGFIFESVGDMQLARFIQNRTDKKQVLQTGLWRYSRHPNYFGEVTQWWGLFFIALSLGGLFSIVGPITITVLILFVSGIPLLEKKQNLNPLYRDYAKQTSKFIPLPPKKL